MSRIKIVWTGEGTYPYVTGGVSTWADLLVTQLKNIDFKRYQNIISSKHFEYSKYSSIQTQLNVLQNFIFKDFKEKILALKLENLSETFFDEVENYIEILNRWNRVHNLTRMNKNEIYHSIFDSVFPLTNIKFQNFLDIGTGAGFPAIPIVLALKSQIQNGFLVEPRIKRSSFLHVLKYYASLL